MWKLLLEWQLKSRQLQTVFIVDVLRKTNFKNLSEHLHLYNNQVQTKLPVNIPVEEIPQF